MNSEIIHEILLPKMFKILSHHMLAENLLGIFSLFYHKASKRKAFGAPPLFLTIDAFSQQIAFHFSLFDYSPYSLNNTLIIFCPEKHTKKTKEKLNISY